MEKSPPSPDLMEVLPQNTHDASAMVNGEKIEISAAEHIEEGGRIFAPTTTFSREEEERVIRSLDWHIMPLIFLLYSLSVLDRSNLGNARIAGMKKDINLTGNRYDWLATVFYIACKYQLVKTCPSSTPTFTTFVMHISISHLTPNC
jgi:hypothetical protein